MDLNTERFHVVGPVGTASEIGQVELNLIPSFVQSHGHGADEWFYPRSRLVIASPKAPPHVFIVQDLHFECEIFLQVLDDHHQKRELDAERFLRIGRTGDVSCAHIGADDFQHQRLDVLIGDALDVPVANLFVPYLQRFASYAVQYREEPGLKSVFEHDCTTDTALFTENFHPRLIYPSKESFFRTQFSP